MNLHITLFVIARLVGLATIIKYFGGEGMIGSDFIVIALIFNASRLISGSPA